MVGVAGTSFWIPSHFRFSIAGFGLIHGLSVVTLFSVVAAIRFARQGRIEAHRKTLTYLAISFWIAGIFTLLPPRILGRIVFG